MNDATLELLISAKDLASNAIRDVKSNLKNMGDEVGNSSGKLKAFADELDKGWKASVEQSKKLVLGVVAAGAAVIGFAASSVKAFQESENRIAQTNAVLKSTGNIAGVTADQVDKLSKSLEHQTKYSDEDVRSVENLLLTFTSISKDIFPQATKTVLDMATALGEDTSSASIQLGKALQDPVLGITALRRVGVNFNDSQKEVIKNLVETGHKAEAQKAILKELNTEFGGSAVAAGSTLAGSLAKLKNEFDDVKESIGGLIAGVATPFLSALLDWFNRIGGVEGVMKLLGDQLRRIKPYVDELAGAILGAMLPAIISMTVAAAEFLLVIAPWALLGIAIVKIWENWDKITRTLTDAMRGLWQWFSNLSVIIVIGQFFSDVLWPALKAVAAAVVENLLPALGQLWDSFKRLLDALNPALTDVLKIVGVIILGTLLAALWAAVSVINIFVQTLSFFISIISNVINWISNLAGWFGNLVGAAYNAIRTIITIEANLVQATRDLIGIVIDIYRGLGSMIVHAVGDLGSILYNAGRSVITGLINGIKDRFGDVKSTLNDLTKKLTSWKGPENVDKTILFTAGQQVIGGFIGGLESQYGDVKRSLGTLTSNLPNMSSGNSGNNNSPPIAGQSGQGIVFNQTNHVYNNVDMREANAELGWRLQNA